MTNHVHDGQVHEVGPTREPVAIVGIGCRLPGGGDSPSQLWQLLEEGVDAVGPIPASRFDAESLYDARHATRGKIMSRWGGYLNNIDKLDAGFFGIAPREAASLDPQQRLLLEVTWEALADAGISSTSIDGTPTGVFVGMWTNEFEARLFADLDRLDLYTTTGSGRYAASGRISYFLNLLGPSITIDTACSSSLVAIHLACTSLWNGETRLALAGGVNVILQPSITVAYSQGRMMAPDGHCKFGDARADGYVRSEGAAIVALKRLSDAVAAGDSIYAVIRGSAVTNDGRSSGSLVTPGQVGHEEMLRNAYRSAGVDPHTVHYVEAHGTGTRAGDPVEMQALGAVVGVGRPDGETCLVGSIKSNIGHTEGAAGVAGLIKAALALHHRRIPASLHVKERNPKVAWDQLKLDICTHMRPWPEDGRPPTAGVSAFGISGTNAHVVLQAAPEEASQVDMAPGHEARAQLLVLSAHSAQALTARARTIAPLLEAGAVDLADLCYSAARQSHLGWRLALVAGTAEGAAADAAAALNASIAGENSAGLHSGEAAVAPRIALVFSGQGGQWNGMARTLLQSEPLFADAIARCDAALTPELGWSVAERLAADPDDGPAPEEIDEVQPLIFAVQVGLAALWQGWGVEVAGVVGHSMGEVAAAYVAGALTLTDAARVITKRSLLLRRIAGQGGMAVVDLSFDDAQRSIADFAAQLAVAVSNSSRSSVVSGDSAALDAWMEGIAAQGIYCRRVKVDVASHSPQVEPLLDELRAGLAGITPRPAQLAIFSTVRASQVEGGELDAEYWAENLRRPVRFAQAVQQMIDDGVAAFIELSPHPVLLPAIEEGLRQAQSDARALPSLRRDEPERTTLLSSLGALYVAGAEINWQALKTPGARLLRLPAYPWQRERHWYEAAQTASAAGVERQGGHPLLGHALRPADRPGSTVWQTTLDLSRMAMLADHRVQQDVFFPATGFVEMLLEAGQVHGLGSCVVEELQLHEALVLEAGAPRQVQITLEAASGGAQRVRVYAAQVGPGENGAQDGAMDGEWRLYAEARLRPANDALAAAPATLAQVQARTTAQDVATAAHELAARGLHYGPAFQRHVQLWRGTGEALAQLAPHLGEASGAGAHVERMAQLDACLQLALLALPASTAGDTYLPVHIENAECLCAETRRATWGYAKLVASEDGRSTCDVLLLDDESKPIALFLGVHLQRVARHGAQPIDELLYELAWVEAPPAIQAAAPAQGDWLLFADAQGEADLVRALTARGENVVTVLPETSLATASPGAVSGSRRLEPGDPEAFGTLIASLCEPNKPPLRGILYAWGAGNVTHDDDALAYAEEVAAAGLLHLVKALDANAAAQTPHLWVITRGAQLVAPLPAHSRSLNPAQALLWGMGRVVATEHPALRCTLIDCSPVAASGDREADANALVGEISAADGGSGEQQVALRAAVRYVPRLQPGSAKPAPRPAATQSAPPGTPFRVAAAEPGVLESVQARTTTRRAPGPGEIEVRVAAAGLNFLDVMKAMAIYPGLEPSPDNALGAECAGTVVAVGSGVASFAVGDEVVAITPSYEQTSCMGAYVTLPAAFAAARPAALSAEAAAGAPVVFVTAHYALNELGHMRRGETALIHAAAGGVGLAAVQLCRRAGVDVIATAGSPEKRAYLRSLGIAHVFDSRTLDFADQVRACTNGRGVDLVLNSLAGEALERSFELLAPRGRFLEIGKRDIYANSRLGMAPFQRNLAFHAIDLARLTLEEPAYVASLFQDVMQWFADGELQPLPIQVLPVGEAAEAFRTMAQARHIGKLILRVADEPVTLPERDAMVKPDVTYLITGGTGGLGLEVARWLVMNGARHLALLARHELPAAARDTVCELEAAGAEIYLLQADVADRAALQAALAEMRASLPPLRGVVHAAGLLADAPLAQMSAQTLHAALLPKLHGAWNLHLLTAAEPLDFFVLFSSVAALLGLAGQANYAAGNAFMDALAHVRRAAGKTALSINWGPWADVGLAAAQQNRGSRLAEMGLRSISPAEGLAALDLLLRSDLCQAAVMRLDAATWLAQPGPQSPLLAGFGAALAGGAASAAAGATPGPGAGLRDMRAALLGEQSGRRRSLLEDAICAQVAQVLRIAPDRIERRKPLKSMGLDSLMALELRNRLEALTGLALSATLAWNHPTIAAIADVLAAGLGVPLQGEAAVPPAPVSKDPSPAEDAALAILADDELAAHLRDELAAIDRLLQKDS